MKKLFVIFLANFLFLIVFGQEKEFEGTIVYRVEVKSKSELLSDKVIRNMAGLGNEITVLVKHGNYKNISGTRTSYYITNNQRVYYKFNNLDTLYYLDYSSDTTSVKNIIRSEEKRNIAGFECKTITIETLVANYKYYYAPLLHMNSEYDKNNRIDRFDVFAKETSSIYLANAVENNAFLISESCIRLDQTSISDSSFQLPALPQKKFSIDELTIPPEFTRFGGWEKYLRANINTELAPKYIKIPKGEEMASETVYVKFLVNEYGKVVKAIVDNPKDVHAKLAEEALRVVNESPLWKPATIYGGEKTVFWLRIPITFEITKK